MSIAQHIESVFYKAFFNGSIAGCKLWFVGNYSIVLGKLQDIKETGYRPTWYYFNGKSPIPGKWVFWIRKYK